MSTGLFNKLPIDEKMKILKENTLYQVITGSTSYGLNTPNSDVDMKAFALLPKQYLFQLDEDWETTTTHDPDIEYHSLKKGISLLNTQNPTMLEMLYTEDRFIVQQNKLGEELRKNRDLFLSQNCYHTFGGYAREQLMRIKNGMEKATLEDKNNHLEYTLRKMTEQFPVKYPDLKVGQLDVLKVFFNEKNKQEVQVKVNFEKVSLKQLNGMISELTQTMRTYNKVNNRNKKPLGKLEKHAMHLVRLLLAGITVLEEGYIPVYQTKHRDMLMDLRYGNFEWDEFFVLVDELNEKLKNALNNTVLPKQTDFKRINELYTDMMLSWY